MGLSVGPVIYVNGKRVKAQRFEIVVSTQWSESTSTAFAVPPQEYRLLFPNYSLSVKEMRIEATRNKLEIHTIF